MTEKKAATESIPASFRFAAYIRVGLSEFSHRRRVLVLPLVYLFLHSASHRSLQGRCMTNLFGKDGHWGCRQQQLVDGKTNSVSYSLYGDSMHCTRVIFKIGITRGLCTPIKGSEHLNDSLFTPTLAMAWQLHHK